MIDLESPIVRHWLHISYPTRSGYRQKNILGRPATFNSTSPSLVTALFAPSHDPRITKSQVLHEDHYIYNGIWHLRCCDITMPSTNLLFFWTRLVIKTIQKLFDPISHINIKSPTLCRQCPGEIFGHNWLKSECFQVQPVPCYNPSVFSLLIWSIFHRIL